jgi:predicted amidohydrolase YtcJ
MASPQLVMLESAANVALALWAYPQDTDDKQQLTKLSSMYDDKDPMLQATEIKLYDDGLSTNITAAVIEPYLIDHGMGMRSTTGLNYCEQDKMAHYITELEKVGFNFNIHVIGGIAVHESLNATEIAQQKNDLPNSPHHHLMHIPYVIIDNIQRFSELDVIADV